MGPFSPCLRKDTTLIFLLIITSALDMFDVEIWAVFILTLTVFQAQKLFHEAAFFQTLKQAGLRTLNFTKGGGEGS